MEKIRDYLFLHLCVVLFSFTSVFSKSASIQFNKGGLQNPLLYVFVFLMFFDCFVYALCWQKVIRKFDLNIGYANRSVYLLWSQIWAVAIFGERLSLRNVAGILIVLAGVIVVSLSADRQGTASGGQERAADRQGTASGGQERAADRQGTVSGGQETVTDRQGTASGSARDPQ